MKSVMTEIMTGIGECCWRELLLESGTGGGPARAVGAAAQGHLLARHVGLVRRKSESYYGLLRGNSLIRLQPERYYRIIAPDRPAGLAEVPYTRRQTGTGTDATPESIIELSGVWSHQNL